MTQLPQRFLNDMKEILKEEFDEFIKSYEENKTTGLRVNTLKMNVDEFLNLNIYDFKSIPWTQEGFYYDENEIRPGKNALHEAGVYYLQEPSAMSAVPKLDIKEGNKILDMCAAPGGKSTYILSKLKNTGLLVSNEINNSRIKALGENLERFGAKNCIITNSDSKGLNKAFKGYFDRILIDAPCSGQGMFRKDEVAIKDWSYEKVLECQNIQREIIRDGYDMLSNGGILVYSTCTFSKEENEDIINEFLEENKNATLLEMERLWPHKIKGEGHFVAKIQKNDEENSKVKLIKFKNIESEIKDYRKFEKEYLNIKFKENLQIKGENLYLLPEESPQLDKLRVLRYGLHLGTLKKNRFEPSHSIAHFLNSSQAKNIENLNLNSKEVMDYLRGNTINTNQNRGWVLVCVNNQPLGWGKESNGILKNHYPKGLRINY